ncbi:MAG: YdcF family protein [Bradyrhizobiaceae bacterium]|nr:MAG: YdcF family protein [Bradyrhizobiaceae bacterium]
MTAPRGSDPVAAPAPRTGRGWRSLAGLGLATAGAAGLVLGAGFFWFASVVPAEEVTLDRDADGIVVLTGGASRVADAVELLARGRGKRLLISGVHHTTTSREIARLMPRFEPLVACCVDLDHSAVNTVGNAIETRRWAKTLGFRSLIVVTSSYHMPRTMVELRRQMPDVVLLSFPVVTERMRAQPWWSSAPTARLLITEYLKYMLAQIRMRIEAAAVPTDLAGGGSPPKS